MERGGEDMMTASMFGMARRGFLVAIAAVVSTTLSVPASANPDAQGFTQRLIDQGIQILKNTSDPQRKPKFREFITQPSGKFRSGLPVDSLMANCETIS